MDGREVKVCWGDRNTCEAHVGDPVKSAKRVRLRVKENVGRVGEEGEGIPIREIGRHIVDVVVVDVDSADRGCDVILRPLGADLTNEIDGIGPLGFLGRVRAEFGEQAVEGVAVIGAELA